MLTVILIMVAGMAFGMVFRSRTKLISVLNKSTLWIIFLLLFFLGVTVGKNPDIMQNLSTIGLRGLQIAVVALLGSLVLAWAVFHLFFKESKHER